MARPALVALAALFLPSALPDTGSVYAAVPSTVCRLERQMTIDPSTFIGTVSTPAERYRFKDGKLFITTPDRVEYIYNDVREVEFGKRYVSGHKTFVFTVEGSGEQRLLMFHSDQFDIRVAEFSCGADRK